MLNRNNSADRLQATTEVPADSPLRDTLENAKPRSCLAVRFARTHSEQRDGDPLITCEVCGKTSTFSTCEPLLVGGEVIGSVLATHPEPLADVTTPVDQAVRSPGRPRTRQPAQPSDRRTPRRDGCAHRAAQQPQRHRHRPAHGRACLTHRLASRRARSRPRSFQADQRYIRARQRRRGPRRRRIDAQNLLPRERFRRASRRRGVPDPAAGHQPGRRTARGREHPPAIAAITHRVGRPRDHGEHRRRRPARPRGRRRPPCFATPTARSTRQRRTGATEPRCSLATWFPPSRSSTRGS